MKFIKWIIYLLLGLVLLTIAFVAITYQADIPAEVLKERYATPPSKFMDVKGMNVHYRDEGIQADSIPLVLLHGTSSHLFTWNGCVSEWAKTRRVIRMDLPAFAITGPDPDNDYTVNGYTSFLHEFLQKLGVSKCYLAGNSLGGLIAYSYANAYPDEVQKLVLIDAAGYPFSGGKGVLAFKLAKIPILRNILKVSTPESVVRKSLEDVYGNKSLVTDSLVRLYRDMTCRTGNRNAFTIRMNMNYAPDTAAVKNVKTRTLVIWGDDDQLIPVANAYKFQRDLPNKQVEILKGLGHIPMEEAPQIVAPMVEKFLKEN